MSPSAMPCQGLMGAPYKANAFPFSLIHSPESKLCEL